MNGNGIMPSFWSIRAIATGRWRQILLVDEDTVGRWVQQYQERGLGGLLNDAQWGGEHGQRELGPAEVEELKRVLGTEAMVGTRVGSGWTNKGGAAATHRALWGHV